MLRDYLYIACFFRGRKPQRCTLNAPCTESTCIKGGPKNPVFSVQLFRNMIRTFDSAQIAISELSESP